MEEGKEDGGGAEAEPLNLFGEEVEEVERRGLMNNTLSEKRSIFVLPQQRLHTQHQLLFKTGDFISWNAVMGRFFF